MRLADEDYLRHLRAASQRFRDVLTGCDPEAPVPSCPEWTAADLLWHLGQGHHWWRAIVANRPAGPDEQRYVEPARPSAFPELLDFFDTHHEQFSAALEAAHPDEECWTWSQDKTVGFILRRQAHEALIHRLDAELTAGGVTPIEPALAADGVAEVLDVMYGPRPTWGHFEPDETHVRIDCTDTDTQVWAQTGWFTGTDDDGTSYDEAHQIVVPDPGVEPDVVVEGLADDLDAWLWHRRDDSAITVTGDRSVYDKWRTVIDQPINDD